MVMNWGCSMGGDGMEGMAPCLTLVASTLLNCLVLVVLAAGCAQAEGGDRWRWPGWPVNSRGVAGPGVRKGKAARTLVHCHGRLCLMFCCLLLLLSGTKWTFTRAAPGLAARWRPMLTKMATTSRSVWFWENGAQLGLLTVVKKRLTAVLLTRAGLVSSTDGAARVLWLLLQPFPSDGEVRCAGELAAEGGM